MCYENIFYNRIQFSDIKNFLMIENNSMIFINYFNENIKLKLTKLDLSH